MSKYISTLGLAISLIFLGVVAVPSTSSAQSVVTCEFARNLTIGTTGEDVRCLQRYLNSQGFIVASTGAGSPGAESAYFGNLTSNALMRWQAARGITQSGTFENTSRTVYASRVGNIVNPSSGTNNIVATGSLSDALRAAIDAVNDAIDDIDDSDADDNDIDNAEEDVIDAKDQLINAFAAAFLDGDISLAIDLAEEAEERAMDAQDWANEDNNDDDNDSDEEDAEDAIDDAQNAIDDARDEIEEADDDGDDVDEAEDLLDEADEALEDAWDAFDDEDYDDAVDFAMDAEELADDAVDAIDEN